MTQLDRRSHWQDVYRRKPDTEVSWFESRPDVSLRLIAETGIPRNASVIDIGGGASRLVDALVTSAQAATAVLDISAAALDLARARLGPRAADVEWIASDVLAWTPSRTYDLWHDRAAFHFLTDPADQAGYAATLSQALSPGGFTIIGTFAPDGPERCSGLPVTRHDAASIAAVLGQAFALVGSTRHDHVTPAGNVQRFQFSTFRKA